MSKKKPVNGSVTHGDLAPCYIYEVFKDELIKELESLLSWKYRIVVSKYPKNNTVLDGLSFMPRPGYAGFETGAGLSSDYLVYPVYYINDFFSAYLDSEITIQETAAAIAEQLNLLVTPDLSAMNDMENPEKALKRICPRLVNTAHNKELLKGIPSAGFLDLSIIFYFIGDIKERGFSSCIVNNDRMSEWGTDIDRLLKASLENGPKLLPPALHWIHDQISNDNLMGDTIYPDAENLVLPSPIMPLTGCPRLYILTNRTAAQGASVILYKNILKTCADAIGGDLYLLPSSVHEFIFLKTESGMDADMLSDMVTDINRHEVAETDRLSDSVYLYSRDTDSISIAKSEGDNEVYTGSYVL